MIATPILLLALIGSPAGIPAVQTSAQTTTVVVPSQAEIITAIRVHGNEITPDDEIIKLAGITIGAPFQSTTIADVTARVKAAHTFEKVDVLKRFASIDDPTQIVIVIVVDEGAATIQIPRDPQAAAKIVRRRGPKNLLFLPILDGEDGYGFTYGVLPALVDVAGKNSRVSFPLSWGGRRRAAVEFEKGFKNPFITRVQVSAGEQQRTNPFYQEKDTRGQLWGRVERAIGPLRGGVSAGWQHVSFAGAIDTFRSIGADVTLDTRTDPFLARNAVFATGTIERDVFPSGPPILRRTYDARGYVGLVGQTVLVVRATREDSDRPLPPYFKSLLGGTSNLRGFDAGTEAGDALVAGSVELRVPLSSALNVAKIGVSVFADTGAAYDVGERLSDQTTKTGIGGSVWIAAAVFHLSLSVAHGLSAGTRVQVGGGIGF